MTKNLFFLFLFIPIRLFGLNNSPYHQDSIDKRQVVWIDLNLGLGVDKVENKVSQGGLFDNSKPISLVTNYSADFGYFKKGIGAYNLRIGYHKEFQLLSNNSLHMFELGLMTGFFRSRKNGNSNVMIGLSLLKTPKYTVSNSNTVQNINGVITNISTKSTRFGYHYNIGIPFEIKSNVNFGTKIGIGVGLEGNINYDMPYIGLMTYFRLKK